MKNNQEQQNKGEIIIYKTKEGKTSLEVKLREETVWLTQKQVGQLFQVDRSVVTKHIGNIFKDGEIKEKSNVQNLHIAHSDKPVKFYNLDIILAVGYRVNTSRGIRFRKWATKVLKDHIIKGFTINQKRLAERKEGQLKELEQAVSLLRKTISKRQLAQNEAVGLLKVITDYTNSWLLLQKYDEGLLEIKKTAKKIVYHPDYDQIKKAIAELKSNLIRKKEASDLFGLERNEALKGILGNINQSFGGKVLYPSIEEKAAHLLYFTIKDHPFSDGNKRIGSFLFIVFLSRNNYLFNKKGERKINDNALVALALLVAESNPKQKEVMVKLIINFLSK